MKEIKDYEKACKAIADKFVKKYFKNTYLDSFWADMGVAFYVNNYWFSLDFMITALEYKATFEQITNYYEMQLDIGMCDDEIASKEPLFSFEDYLKFPDTLIIETGENGYINFRIENEK